MTNRIFICRSAPISSPIALLNQTKSLFTFTFLLCSKSASGEDVGVLQQMRILSGFFFGTPRISIKIWLEHQIAITSSLVARKCPTRLSSIIFQDPKNREIYRSDVMCDLFPCCKELPTWRERNTRYWMTMTESKLLWTSWKITTSKVSVLLSRASLCEPPKR